MNSKNKQLTLAYLNTFTFSCVQIFLYITIAYIVEHTNVEMSSFVGAIGAGSLIFAITGPLWAARSDSWGRKKVLNIGMLGMGLSFLILSLIFVFNDQLSIAMKTMLIFLSRIVYGLLVSAIVPVSQAWQLDVIDNQDKIKVLSRNSMCLSLGRILGPILILFKQVNFEHMIYWATTWIFILVVISFLIKTQEKPRIQSEVSLTAKMAMTKWFELFKESLLPIGLCLVFTAFIGILQSSLGIHAKTTLGISGNEATVLMAQFVLAISVLGLISLSIAQKVFKKEWKKRLIIGSTTLILGSFFLEAGTNLTMIWAAVVILSCGMAFIPPVYLALISQTTSEDNVNGKKIGFASISHSLGYAIGNGFIALSLKMKLLSLTSVISLFSVFTFIIVMMLLKQQKDFVMPDKKKMAEA